MPTKVTRVSPYLEWAFAVESPHMRNDRRSIFGWAMYDWANSAYTTTTLAVLLPAIFTGEIMPEGGVSLFGRLVDGESMFSFMVSAAAIIAFVVSPVLGAIGDFTASKLRLLRVFAYTGAVLSIGFAFLGAGAVWPTVILFLVVETCWAIAAVFYDSLLPHLTTSDTIDRVSSRGSPSAIWVADSNSSSPSSSSSSAPTALPRLRPESRSCLPGCGGSALRCSRFDGCANRARPNSCPHRPEAIASWAMPGSGSVAQSAPSAV